MIQGLDFIIQSFFIILEGDVNGERRLKTHLSSQYYHLHFVNIGKVYIGISL